MLRRLVSGTVLCALALPGHAVVVNGDFASGLTGWTSDGDVSVTAAAEARLGDNGSFGVLYQGVAEPAGGLVLRFDYNPAGLSANVPGGTFPDLFYASLYFIDDLPSFSLDPANPVFDDVIPLFDLDFSGVTCGGAPGACGGTLADIGGGWYRYSLAFPNAYQYAIPVFELRDGNFLVDSHVLVDNVEILPAAAPVPGTLFLLLGGLALRLRRLRARA